MKLTDEQIKTMQEALKNATPGPWEYWTDTDTFLGTLGTVYKSHNGGKRFVADSTGVRGINNTILIANAPEWIRQLIDSNQAWKEETEAASEEATECRLEAIKNKQESIKLQGQLSRAVEVLEKTLEYTSEWKTKTRINNFLASLSQEKHTRKQPQEHPLDLLYTTKGLNGSGWDIGKSDEKA